MVFWSEPSRRGSASWARMATISRRVGVGEIEE